MTELQDKSKAQSEQIDELHKQMAELKMQAGGKLFVEDAGAAALLALVMNADNEIAIAKAGGIPPLVALIRDGNDAQKESAAAALSNLAGNADNQIAIAQAKREADIEAEVMKRIDAHNARKAASPTK